MLILGLGKMFEINHVYAELIEFGVLKYFIFHFSDALHWMDYFLSFIHFATN